MNKLYSAEKISTKLGTPRLKRLPTHSINPCTQTEQFDLCSNNFKIPTILDIFGSNEYHIS
jgi:hypothetical protein